MLLAEMTVGEKFATGGITAGIGICITFLVLAVLICLVILVTKFEKIDLKTVLKKLSKKEEKGKSGAESEVGTEPAEAADDKKLVAAITAAVAVALEAERADDAPKASFKVKSIKRI